jgi:magnesium transporter
VTGRRHGDRIPLRGAAQLARDLGGFVWIGLQQATDAQVVRVAQEFQLPDLAVEDALHAHQRPKLECYDDVLFAVLKPVRYVDHDEVVDLAEIALFAGDHFVVTVRHGDSDVLTGVRADLGNGGLPEPLQNPLGVLYRALDRTVDAYADVVTAVDTDLAEIEAQVFGHDEGDHAERIYKLKREVLEFRRAAIPLREPLEDLAEGRIPMPDPEAATFFRDVHDHLLRTIDGIENHDRLLSDVLQANVARVSVRQSAIAVRQNEDMRRISAWAAIALVPTAIAGIYGMNFDTMPELRWHYGYYAVLVVIGVTCFGLHRLFRRNGWL